MIAEQKNWRYIPVIIPLSNEEYSTHNIGPAWHARTASHVPRETDHILAVQSSLPVITVSPTILSDLHFYIESNICLHFVNTKYKRSRNIILVNLIHCVCPESLCICLLARMSHMLATLLCMHRIKL